MGVARSSRSAARSREWLRLMRHVKPVWAGGSSGAADWVRHALSLL
jgi:hypothetical protein